MSRLCSGLVSLFDFPQNREARMLGWFQALMPKEMRFFELFVQHATIVVAGAEALRGLLRGGRRDRALLQADLRTRG